ncbi:2-methylcitrate dehydratase PrpD [Caldalkalibacillus uzonensis]|uniref:2-methylcitrate dehydratase PrpD n=1 Tax=Caldalkalibacillus uzonensis TaxID=353224 RepID=A0ABU0CNE8_9BACI|nr:MmgE/PrpD family protein [Caldalkalibacillus uzonensis]MDQ0337411.1 2-methylcitrate dehydratase PrpD [Caldalkalibacillus uzonensis]
MDSHHRLLVQYIQQEHLDRCGEDVVESLKGAVIDVVGAIIAGAHTEAAQIAYEMAASQWAEGPCSVMIFDRTFSSTGAAFVHAVMANALDIDDGHRLVKGHPGAVIFPAVFAAGEEQGASGRNLLTALLIGYEVGIRAGILAHQLRPEYHCTGSWGSIGAAAGVARLMRLSPSAAAHALGIAEYHGTYSPMMRGIDHPSMVKDAIGWGSLSGIAAALLAAQGFTGIPSLFSCPEAKMLLDELGEYYRIRELYYKPYACCRWAHPAVEGVRFIKEHYQLSFQQVERIVIHTFKEAACLSRRPPANTEEAQYNLAFPVAAFLVCGEVGPRQVLAELNHPAILELMDKLSVQVKPEFDQQFPAKTMSQVEIMTRDGKQMASPVMQARGDVDNPMPINELKEKFLWLTSPCLGAEHAEDLLTLLTHLEELEDIKCLSRFFSRLVQSRAQTMNK